MTEVSPKYLLYQETCEFNFPTKRRSFSDNSQKTSHFMLCKKHSKYKVYSGRLKQKNEQ